jgi:hypothetical protein
VTTSGCRINQGGHGRLCSARSSHSQPSGIRKATIRLAELLLNAGCSWNTVRAFDLEGEAGFSGVTSLSAELRIALPGSDLWIASRLHIG